MHRGYHQFSIRLFIINTLRRFCFQKNRQRTKPCPLLKYIVNYGSEKAVALTVSTNLFTVSEFPSLRDATYRSTKFSHGSKGTKETPDGAIFLTQAGTKAIPSPWATNCSRVDLSMISQTMFGWVPIFRKPLHNASYRIGRACLG